MKNKIGEGKVLDLYNSIGSSVASGGIVVQGLLTGIATQTHANLATLPCEMEGVFDLSVTDSATGGIALGAIIRCTLADKVLSNAAYSANTTIFFGYALEAVADGATATIKVLKVMSQPIE